MVQAAQETKGCWKDLTVRYYALVLCDTYKYSSSFDNLNTHGLLMCYVSFSEPLHDT